jgi:hypothetical protein
VVLLVAFYWLFVALGVWSIVSGILRYVLRVYPLKSVQDVFNGVFNLVLAFFINYYLGGGHNLTFFIGSLIVYVMAQIVFAVFIGDTLTNHLL